MRGYEYGDPMMRVYDGPQFVPHREFLHEGLEYVYSCNQHVDANHRPWYEGRSLSKGDVICLGDKAYSVETVGFQYIEDFEVPV